MKTRRFATLIVLLAGLACNLAQPTVTGPAEPHSTSNAATEGPSLTETATRFPLAPLDRRDGGSALRWLLYAIEHRDIAAFRELTGAEFFGYANYLEGG